MAAGGTFEQVGAFTGGSMGIKTSKGVSKWMKPDRHTAEAIEQAAKLMRQLEEAEKAAKLMRQFEEAEKAAKLQRQVEKETGLLLSYLNNILDVLQRSCSAQHAIDMVGLFSDPQTDGDKLQDWIDDNRDSLTVEDLKAIVMAAMAHGAGEALSAHMKAVQAPRAEKAQEIYDEIRQRWEYYKSKGMSKNAAHDRIAREVGQKPGTVRGKLKGL
jgi:hypothetical protein